jgi:hypothetical protein
LPPDFLPPLLEAPGELAILAARSFDMPLFFSTSNLNYVDDLTLCRVPPRLHGPGCLEDRIINVVEI